MFRTRALTIIPDHTTYTKEEVIGFFPLSFYGKLIGNPQIAIYTNPSLPSQKLIPKHPFSKSDAGVHIFPPRKPASRTAPALLQERQHALFIFHFVCVF